MKISPKIIVPAAVLAVATAGAYGASQARASSSGNGSLVQQIADTFHLDKSKVQAVFDANRAQHQQQAESRYEDRLTQAVKDGQLTQAQKDAILAEHSKLKAEADAASSSTGTDRHTKMKQIRTEAQDWARQNNLDIKWLMPAPHHGMGVGHHMIGQ